MNSSIIKVVETEDGVPALTFREDAHLSWFRGYRFQVSGSLDGDGDYGSSSTSLQGDLELADDYNLPAKKSELLKNLMSLSHVFEATCKYKDFWELTYRDSSLLNELMHQTDDVDHNISSKNFDFETLIKTVITSKELGDVEEKARYVLIDPKTNKALVLISIGDNYIALQNTDTQVWNKIEVNTLFEIDFDGYGWGQLMTRLLYVLQCKAQFYIDHAIKYVNGNKLIGKDLDGKYSNDKVFNYIGTVIRHIKAIKTQNTSNI